MLISFNPLNFKIKLNNFFNEISTITAKLFNKTDNQKYREKFCIIWTDQ